MQIGSVVLCFLALIVLVSMSVIATSIRIVPEDTRLSVYRLGRYIGDKGPGIVFRIPFIDRTVIKKLGAMENISSPSLLGQTGEARTTVYTDGKVLLAGEEWDAMSQSPISAGQRVRVVRIILEVEKE